MADDKPKTLSAVPDLVAALKTPPFPSKYADPLITSDTKLKDALNDAITDKSFRTAIAIVALKADGTRPVASFRGNEVHYSASMIKVAAMYALYELRKVLKEIAKELVGKKSKKEDFLTQCERYLKPHIQNKVKDIPQLKGVSDWHAQPKYAEAFEAKDPATTGDPLEVDFNKIFMPTKKDEEGRLEKMIGLSRNNPTAECIHAAGYGYIMGALTSGGFFDPAATTPKGKGSGIWLAGDYADDFYKKEFPDPAKKKYPYYRIQSENDKDVAQATTVLQWARLLTLMADKKLVDDQSSLAMQKLMVQAAKKHGEVWINRVVDEKGVPQGGLEDTFADVTHIKLGVGPLKGKPLGEGGDVYSEGGIIRHVPTDKRFVFVWQNYKIETDLTWGPIADVIRKTITAYVK